MTETDKLNIDSIIARLLEGMLYERAGGPRISSAFNWAVLHYASVIHNIIKLTFESTPIYIYKKNIAP